MQKSQLVRELRMIQAELQNLGDIIITKKNEDAHNHRLALSQHVTRIIKELENGN